MTHCVDWAPLFLLLLVAFHFALSDEFWPNSTAFPSSSDRFWVSTSVDQIRFRKECISTQLCAEPRFSLIHQMPKFNERLSRDWPIAKAEVPGISLDFFTFWARGMPSDVTLQAVVHGIDPKFKFSRVCDESAFVSVFQFVTGTNDQKGEEGDEEKVQLQLHAQCFNTTLTVELFRRRCPWCPTSSSEAAQQKEMAQLMDSPPPFLCQFPLQFRTNLLIVLLAVATGINVLAFVGLLLICERQRRNGKNKNAQEKQGQSKENGNCLGQIVVHRTQQQNHRPTTNPKNRPQQTTRTQQLLPTISEEFIYEVIDDGTTAAEVTPKFSLRLAHGTTKAFQRQPKMVQLPLSNKCDHCFLRVQGDDRCSCGSLDTSLESNWANSLSADENDENFGEFAHSSFVNDNASDGPNNAIDSGLDGSNHTEEEKK